MFGINKLENYFHNRYLKKAFNRNSQSTPFTSYFDYWDNKPQWLSLSTPSDFEDAVRFNPIVKAAINLLATSGSNGKKILVDAVSGEEIEWSAKDKAVQKAKKILTQRPNPLQSAKEFQFQGLFYLKTFGNRYVYGLMPSGFTNLDLMDVEVMYNLPSQFMDVRKTGQIYGQTELSGIISKYARKNVSPAELYEPEQILHFNEVNISSDAPSIMGISKLEVLKEPITNIHKCFEAMNTILTSRGMQGIISIDSKDGQGTIMPLDPQLKKDTQKTFKEDYGLLNGQNPFLISPVPIDYVKTVMSSSEMGIYEEFSNNSIIVGNEYGVPPELIKTYIKNATYENQIQSVRRLYQDTTIPMVSDEDEYWTYRLNTEKYGFRVETNWDHIPALADSFREKAAALNMRGKTAKDAYEQNIITVNQYLGYIDQPQIPGGDVIKYDWDKNKKPIENETEATE